jgi:hypothetical protein
MKIFSLALFLLIAKSDGLKIFAVFPLGTHSHFAVGDSILKALWKVGHEITVVSPFPQKVKLERFRDISTVDTLEMFRSGKFEYQKNIFNFLSHFFKKYFRYAFKRF